MVLCGNFYSSCGKWCCYPSFLLSDKRSIYRHLEAEIPTVLSDILFRVSHNPQFIRIAFRLLIAGSSSLPGHYSCSHIFHCRSNCKTSKLIHFTSFFRILEIIPVTLRIAAACPLPARAKSMCNKQPPCLDSSSLKVCVDQFS